VLLPRRDQPEFGDANIARYLRRPCRGVRFDRSAQTELPGKLVRQIPLPVEGWMDHLSVDVRGGRLFVPAEQQRSLEVVDVK
jgi:hypothetical protein